MTPSVIQAGQPLFAGRARNLAIAAALLLPGAGLVAGCGGGDTNNAEWDRYDAEHAARVSNAVDAFEARGFSDQIANVQPCGQEAVPEGNCYTFDLAEGNTGKVDRVTTQSSQLVDEIDRENPSLGQESKVLIYEGGRPKLLSGLTYFDTDETVPDEDGMSLSSVTNPTDQTQLFVTLFKDRESHESLRAADQRVQDAISQFFAAVKSKA